MSSYPLLFATNHRVWRLFGHSRLGYSKDPKDRIAGDVSPAGKEPARDVAIENLEEKSTAELLKLLSGQLTELVHHEMELARAELGRKSKKFGLGAGMFGSAGVFAVGALGAFVTAAIAGIATALGVWGAALVVAGACLLIAGAFALAGLTELAQGAPPLPEEALESTKEDLTWIRTHARSAKQ